MLPSEKPKHGLSYRKDNNKMMLYPKTEEDHSQAQYVDLYILSDEEIKEGDAYYSKFTKQVHINAGDSKIEWCNTKSSRYRKIIATTDSLLKYVDVLDHHYVDKIPQHIIEAYVKKPFDEVEVEYESHGCYTNGTWNHVEYKPKLNQDGTLAVSLVKFIDDFDYSNNPLHPVIEEKMYSREEVIDFGEYLMKLVNSVIKKNTKMKPLNETSGEKLVKDLFDKWIK